MSSFLSDRGPGLAAAATATHGGGVRRPGTTSECSPNANTPNSTGQRHRPQTSPPVAFAPGRRHDSDGAPDACRSPPQRMQSRVFLQSAMDLSLSPPGLIGAGGGRNGGEVGCGLAGGQQQHQRRQGVASAAGTSRRGLNSASCSDLPLAGAGGSGRRMPGGRPSTSSAVLPSNRKGGGGGGGGTVGEKCLNKGRSSSRGGVSSQDGGGGPDAGGQTPAASGPPHAGFGHEVIDLGVVSDVTPRPRVWGERQLAAAAAAAAGRSRSEGVRGGVRAGVTRGGVVLDSRFAKVRKTLRRDVLEAAERARLPLLQA